MELLICILLLSLVAGVFSDDLKVTVKKSKVSIIATGISVSAFAVFVVLLIISVSALGSVTDQTISDRPITTENIVPTKFEGKGNAYIIRSDNQYVYYTEDGNSEISINYVPIEDSKVIMDSSQPRVERYKGTRTIGISWLIHFNIDYDRYKLFLPKT